MTHAQRTQAGTNAFLPAAFAALVMAAALALAIIANGVPTPKIGGGAGDGITMEQAVVDAGRAWELQREQQAGIGVISHAVRDSAAAWEEQRRAQSGESYRTNDELTVPPGL